jgi:hypothetical protein
MGRPPSPPGPPHCQKSFQTKFPGKGARMNFRFSLAPPGGPPTPTLAAGAAASRPPWQPPSVDHDELPAAAPSTMQERCIR